LAVFHTWLGDRAGWAQATQQPRPILWRENAFTIPFRVHADLGAPVAPAEIWLYVSTDHGASWSHVATDDPQAGRFDFRAAGDGEYWFSLRTLDRFGTVRPKGGQRVELRVIVDTTMPRLEVGGAKGATGAVQVRWRADDVHLDPDSLTVEYRCETDPYWQSLSIGPDPAGRPATADRRTMSGQATWYPVPGCRRVTVRAKVRDAAGNWATREADIDLSEARERRGAAVVSRMASAGKGDPPPVEDRRSPRLARRIDDPYAWAVDQSSDVPLERWLAGQAGPLVASGPVASIAKTGSARPATVAAAADRSRQLVPTALPGGPLRGGWSAARRRSPAGNTPAAGLPGRSPPAANQADRTDRPGAAPQADDMACNAVRSRTFDISYHQLPVDQDATLRQQLWETTDLGTSWRPVEATEVGRESLRVSVRREGLYGFRIASVRADGRGGPAPVPGDRPDVWVHVDWTPPLARIVSVDSGTNGSPSTLTIRWEASDRRLAPHPIALYYRWNSEQAWSPIAVDLDNTGQFVWRTGLERIGAVALRLDVRDFAGNVTSVQAAHDAAEPVPATGHIFRMPPVDRSAQRPPAAPARR